MGDYDWIGPLISGVAKGAVDVGTGLAANNQIQGSYSEMLRRLMERMGEYDSLGDAGYQPLVAQQLGPSALENIQEDPAGRQSQLEAMAALQELAQNGGLSLADLQALNQIEGRLNQQDTARRKGLANEFAARGQLGAGAQLAMAMRGQQDAAQNANQRAESVAAQAQQRALNAILQRGQLGRQMSGDKYGRDRDAALARDAIEARNAASRMDTARGNNAIAGQRFSDNLARLQGKTGLTNSLNQTTFGSGVQNARTTGAMGSYANNLIDSGKSTWDAWNKDAPDYSHSSGHTSGSGSHDEEDDYAGH